MSNLNDKPLSYGNLSRFYDKLKTNKLNTLESSIDSIETELEGKQDTISDLSTIRSGAALGATALQSVPAEYVTETEMGTALSAKQDVLSAGQNIEIEDNTVSAKGYFYDDEPKEELKLIDDILTAAGMPAGQSLGLKISSAAGATTYTWTDDMGGFFAQMIQMNMLPGVGATYQTANGKSGVIAAVDATTITFEETLDADNALTEEPVDYVVTTSQLFSFTEGIYDYVESDMSLFEITLSGVAGATTYTYPSNISSIKTVCSSGNIFKLQDNRSAKITSIDETNHTITFESTFDADNALVDELVVSRMTKNNASGLYSHVECGGVVGTIVATNTASGMGSHAEGFGTTAEGVGSHAEGESTIASGVESHAEGLSTTASGQASHAEGSSTTASGRNSHTEGFVTTAQNFTEHADGNCNVSHKASDTYGNGGNTQHSVGINNKNAFEIMQNGDVYVYGIGGYVGTDTTAQDATIKTLQSYIASLEARIAALEGA